MLKLSYKNEDIKWKGKILRNIENKKFIQFAGKVITVEHKKLKAPKSPPHDKEVWILNLNKNKIYVLPELLGNKDFLQRIKDNEVLNKTFAFTIINKGGILSKC